MSKNRRIRIAAPVATRQGRHGAAIRPWGANLQNQHGVTSPRAPMKLKGNPPPPPTETQLTRAYSRTVGRCPRELGWLQTSVCTTTVDPPDDLSAEGPRAPYRNSEAALGDPERSSSCHHASVCNRSLECKRPSSFLLFIFSWFNGLSFVHPSSPRNTGTEPISIHFFQLFLLARDKVLCNLAPPLVCACVSLS